VGEVMFSQCANPKCATPFEYHLGGRFFRFRQGERAPHSERNTHAVVHFWLCPRCAETYTLDYDRVRGLLIQPVARGHSAGEALIQVTDDEEDWTGRGNESAVMGLAAAGHEKGAQR
jgi:hypothetical protein